MGFQTYDGIPDMGGVPVMWWDTRHRWDTRQGWWGPRHGWQATSQVVVYQMQVYIRSRWVSRHGMMGYQKVDDGVPDRG